VSIREAAIAVIAGILLSAAGAFWMLKTQRVIAFTPAPTSTPAVYHDKTDPDKPVYRDQAVNHGDAIFAAQGRIEGLHEAVQVGSAVTGVLDQMLYHEGDFVEKGRVLAHIDCRPTESERMVARAELDATAAGHQRLLRGSRTEERLEAEANTAAAADTMERAKQHFERLDSLLKKTSETPENRDQALRDFQVAVEQHKAAAQREHLVKAGPLPEEIAKSEAQVRAAQSHLDQLERQLDLCVVRAPVSGTVLRVFKHVGEAYSTVFPEPILSLDDTSGFRVRAEVDERDINRVFAGQKAEITADAFDGKSVAGRVEVIGAEMGRKKARSADPAERSDRDILEVLITLDGTDLKLVPELRVTVQFFPKP
jgi:HlyD family secretion protein